MVQLTDEEQEIIQFYKEGMSIKDIAECTGHKPYRIKKLVQHKDLFIFRQLNEYIPECSGYK